MLVLWTTSDARLKLSKLDFTKVVSLIEKSLCKGLKISSKPIKITA